MKEKKPSYRVRLLKGMMLGLALFGLAGCANNSSNSGYTFKEVWTYSDGVPRRMEADYGRSVVNNRLEMMITPPDAVDTRPATGLPPIAAKNAQDRYDKSFREKEEAPALKVLMK
jgi:hypothetical protein